MIEKKDMDDVCFLNVSGSIDHMEMVDLRNVISEIINEGHSKVILNLKDVKNINYMGIGVLIERLKKIRSCGGDIKLVGMSSYVRNFFNQVGIADVFDSFESIEEARKSFFCPPGRKSKAL